MAYGKRTYVVFPNVLKKRILIPALALLLYGGYSYLTKDTEKNYEQRLRNAEKIEIKEDSFGFGKHYGIFVNAKKVAKVDGKSIKLWADKFTLRTKDNKTIASETENKRILFQYNRSAEVFGPDNKTSGYIAEERIKDMFSFSYVFHFYDAYNQELGTSRKLGKSALNFHSLYDKKGNKDYDINKRFPQFLLLGGDRYTLTVKDKKSEIPLEQAIFITCIEDAIADSH